MRGMLHLTTCGFRWEPRGRWKIAPGLTSDPEWCSHAGETSISLKNERLACTRAQLRAGGPPHAIKNAIVEMFTACRREATFWSKLSSRLSKTHILQRASQRALRLARGTSGTPVSSPMTPKLLHESTKRCQNSSEVIPSTSKFQF